MNGSHSAAKHSLTIAPEEKRAIERPRARETPGKAKGDSTGYQPRYLFRSWGKIVARIRNAEICALLLDFDGTLVKLQRRPWDVRVPQRTKRLLRRLAAQPQLFVAIVSGRRCRDLQTRIGVKTLHIIGLHGAEEKGKYAKISNTAANCLARTERAARKQLSAMRGMRVENKHVSFAVHYREATIPTARAAKACLSELVAPLQKTLRVLAGAMVWEVLPNEIRGKGGAVRDLLNEFPPGTPAIYIGDDGTDESAFRALTDQITVRVGTSPSSRAKYYLRDTHEVIRFLLRLEEELA
jgi:trehalose 6-phosphate phosphatase